MAYACTEEEYKIYYDDLSTRSQRIKKWIDSSEMEHWCNALFPGERYGNMYSNVAESFNSWILDARNMAFDELVDKIRVQSMEMMAFRKVKSAEWTTHLCPSIELKIKENINSARGIACSIAIPGDVVEVHSDPKYFVNLNTQDCSCKAWRVYRVPCIHACAAAQFARRSIYDLCVPYYTSSLYRLAYERSILPITSTELAKVDTSNIQITPWTTKVRAGRPKRKRIPSEYKEYIKCGRCQNPGHHNRRTCTKRI